MGGRWTWRLARAARKALDRTQALARAADDRNACILKDAKLAAVHDTRAHGHEIMRLRALAGGLGKEAGVVLLAAGTAERLVVDRVAAAEHDRIGRGVVTQQAQCLRRGGAKIAAPPRIEQLADRPR